MRIEAFLRESPMFTVKRAARRFDAVAAEAFAADDLGFMEGLVLAAIFFETPRSIKPSQLANTFVITRSNVSHTVSSLEAKGLIQRKIDPSDARGVSADAETAWQEMRAAHDCGFRHNAARI